MEAIDHKRVERIKENLGIIVSSIINDFEDPSHLAKKETVEYLHTLHRKRGNGSEQVRKLGLSICTIEELNAAVRAHENFKKYNSFMVLLHEESSRVNLKIAASRDPHVGKDVSNGDTGYKLSSGERFPSTRRTYDRRRI